MSANITSTPFISSRALSNLAPGSTSKLGEVRSHAFYNQYDPESNPSGIIALAIAENKLMRDEITSYINNKLRVTPWHLTYGHGPQGSIPLRKAVSEFVNKEFHPYSSVEQDHVCICNGAGSAVNNLSFVLAEPDDGILVGRPLYVSVSRSLLNTRYILCAE